MELKKKVRLQLEQMRRRIFRYSNTLHCFLDYTINAERCTVTISTNIKEYTKSFDATEEFLGYWSEITMEDLQPVPVTEFEQRAMPLIQLLSENIEKTKSDIKFIPQANAVNAQANTILALYKTMQDDRKRSKRA